jgi:transposase
MDQQRTANKSAPTIWEIPDDVWPMIHTILDDRYPAKPTGHRRIDLRRGPNRILYRLRTGCPWNQLPKPSGFRHRRSGDRCHRPYHRLHLQDVALNWL